MDQQTHHDSARGDERAQAFRLKPLRSQIRYRHWSIAQQPILIFLTEAAYGPAKFAELPHFAG